MEFEGSTHEVFVRLPRSRLRALPLRYSLHLRIYSFSGRPYRLYFVFKLFFAVVVNIVTRESCSLEANNALLFYLFVNIFLVPSLLEGASNFCEGAKDMAESTHAAGYD